MSELITKAVLNETLEKALTDFGVKIFHYFDTRFAEIDKRFEKVDLRFDALESRMDGFAKQLEDFRHESIVRDARADRHERWIGQLADKTRLKLEY
jgi:hypothetical protein